ncbi:hypothetical protein Tco_0915436 [Tanacetum coccineum]
MTYVHISSGLALQRQNDVCSHQFRPRSLVTKWRLLTTLQAPFLKRKESSGLVPQPPSPTPNLPPTKNDWDSLFCPMFDEYFNPSPSVVQPVLVAGVQEPVVSTGTPSSTRIDQDTPSTSTSQTTQEEQSHVIPTSVEEDDHGIEVAHMDNDLNLTKPGWDATGYEFKHDYTIIESPRAVIFPVNNNERKIMRFNEIYKFSDGTLTRILEILDYRVKEFKIKQLNPGMNTRFWTEKDVTRSKEFIMAIERRLKTKRIYQNLECFVGGRVCDIDYRLLQRTE